MRARGGRGVTLGSQNPRGWAPWCLRSSDWNGPECAAAGSSSQRESVRGMPRRRRGSCASLAWRACPLTPDPVRRQRATARAAGHLDRGCAAIAATLKALREGPPETWRPSEPEVLHVPTEWSAPLSEPAALAGAGSTELPITLPRRKPRTEGLLEIDAPGPTHLTEARTTPGPPHGPPRRPHRRPPRRHSRRQFGADPDVRPGRPTLQRWASRRRPSPKRVGRGTRQQPSRTCACLRRRRVDVQVCSPDC